MDTKDLQQTAVFKGVSAHDVYETLMDSQRHAEFSGAPADIKREIGAVSTAYGDWLETVNVELVPDQKIVQKWRSKNWPAGHYSMTTYVLEQDGADTKLSFSQTGIPAEEFDHITSGWIENYWDKMKKVLEK